MGDTIKFWKGVMRRRNEAKATKAAAEAKQREATERKARQQAAANKRSKSAGTGYIGTSQRRRMAMRDAMKDD